MAGEVSGGVSHVFSYLIVSAILVSAFMPCSIAQVIHENPADIAPYRSPSINDQIASALSAMLSSLNAVSVNITANHFNGSNSSISGFENAYNKYKDLLWRLNLSTSDYNAILDGMNSSEARMGMLLKDSENYNVTRNLYLECVSSGDSVNASIYATMLQNNYSRIIASYDDLRANATVINNALTNASAGQWNVNAPLNSLNGYVRNITDDYNMLGIAPANVTVRLSADRSLVSIGGSVSFFIQLTTGDGKPLEGSGIALYLDNRQIGSLSTNDTGLGSMVYVIPANVTGDDVLAHAEYVPAGSIEAISFSNDVELNVTDEETRLSMGLDRSSAAYGDMVNVSGVLASYTGTLAPGKTIAIYLNDADVGNATTGNDGSYVYTLPVTSQAPGGACSVHAEYTRSPGDVFLGSISADDALDIAVLNTSLTLHSDKSSYGLGDMVNAGGMLETENGLPAGGENVTIYLDDTALCTVQTGLNGTYNVGSAIPFNVTAGHHTLYAVYDPGFGKSLESSSSDKVDVAFDDSGRAVKLNGMPLILFDGDVLHINGALVTGNGVPIAGKVVLVNLSGVTIGTLTTDPLGLFNMTYTVNDKEYLGVYSVSVSDVEGGMAPAAVSSADLLIVPYNEFTAVSVLVIVIVLIAAFALMARSILSRRRTVEPEAAAPAQAPQAPEYQINVALDIAVRPKVDIIRKLDSLRSTITEGNFPEAVTGIYTTLRNMAIEHGMNVPDSMTHNEFYAAAASRYPSLDAPFGHIMRTYERVSYGRGTVSGPELNMAMDSLREIYERLASNKEVR